MLLALVNKGSTDRRKFLVYTGGLALATSSATSARPAPSGGKKSVTAWLTRYDWEDAVQSLLRNADNIETVSPAWYDILEGGMIRPNLTSHVDDERLLKLAWEKGLRLRPLIMNVSAARTQPEIVRPLLGSESARTQHHRRLHALASLYDGLSLDYEGLRLPDMPGFVRLVEEASDVMRDTRKSLSVCIEALPGDEMVGYWRRIADSADAVYLMAYGQKPKTPGPFVSLAWLEDVAKRGLAAMSPQRLVLGLAIYGLSWGPNGVTSGTWQQYQQRARALRASLERDRATGMLYYRHDGEEAWIEDGVSIGIKMRIGWRAGIRRFAFWRLGGEDPQIWQAVRDLPNS